MIKNIKKGSTYYLDFHTNYDIGDIELDDYENVPIFCEQVWKRVRVKT
jgi:hypothetical protein